MIKGLKYIKAINISDCNIEEGENDTIIEAIETSGVQFEKLGYM